MPTIRGAAYSPTRSYNFSDTATIEPIEPIETIETIETIGPIGPIEPIGSIER